VVTHEARVAGFADRTVLVRDGVTDRQVRPDSDTDWAAAPAGVSQPWVVEVSDAVAASGRWSDGVLRSTDVGLS
jgi:hypothetical protein